MKHFITLVFLVTCGLITNSHAETLPPLENKQVSQDFKAMWAGFDPRAEPLDTEVLKEWEEDGVVMKVLRYRVGIFKGQKSMMAAVYGYPKGANKLPGLVQIHGGGQYADYKAVLTNAKRGYATISIAWAGRLTAPDYHVSPNVVKLFWDNENDNPHYKVTTDWGALDAYHAPSKKDKDAFTQIPAYEWSLDSVASPRNNAWFLCTLGARRALTFLEQQPQVDPAKLGVYGHSMGGKLTVLTAAADKRVKAAAPSCGGISDRSNKDPLFRNSVGDSTNLKNISCPTIFLSPANDFHGRIIDLIPATKELGKNDWRVTCSAHINHKDMPQNEVATQLWFDQYLKGTFQWPKTPTTKLTLKTESRSPVFTITADTSKPIKAIDIYYTQQGDPNGGMQNHINQFWHHAHAQSSGKGGTWSASLPLFTTDKPLWVYANVLYALEKPITGAGYYYGRYTTDTFNLSSLLKIVSPTELQQAGVKATLKASPVIESFASNWQKEWFTTNPSEWARSTHKLYHPLWSAPADKKSLKLSIDIRSEQANTMIVGLDKHVAEIKLVGCTGWQTITLSPSDFLDADNKPLNSWQEIKELHLAPSKYLRPKNGGERRLVGSSKWQGVAPQFRNLRWHSTSP